MRPSTRLSLIFPFMFVMIINCYCQLEIGAQLTPGYVNYIKAVDKGAKPYNVNDEEPTFGFETGFIVRMALNQDIYIESGIRYSRLGIKFQSDFLVDGGSRKVTDFIIHRFDYINIPIIIQLNLLPNRRLAPLIKTGLQNYIFLEEYFKSSGKLLVNKEDQKAVKEWQKNDAWANRIYTPGVSLGVGIQGKLGERFKYSVVPTINYQLLNIDGNRPPIRRNIYLTGVEFMVTYRLNKKEAKFKSRAETPDFI